MQGCGSNACARGFPENPQLYSLSKNYMQKKCIYLPHLRQLLDCHYIKSISTTFRRLDKSQKNEKYARLSQGTCVCQNSFYSMLAFMPYSSPNSSYGFIIRQINIDQRYLRATSRQDNHQNWTHILTPALFSKHLINCHCIFQAKYIWCFFSFILVWLLTLKR